MFEALSDCEKPGTGDYCRTPRETRNEPTIDPCIFMVQGALTLLTSLAALIVVGGNCRGLAGVDLHLDFFQKHTDELRSLAMRGAQAVRDAEDRLEGAVEKASYGSAIVEKTSDAFTAVAQSAATVGEIVKRNQ